MSEPETPTGDLLSFAVSLDWDGSEGGIAGAEWVAVDGIGDIQVSEGAADQPPYRTGVLSAAGPVVDVITATGWYLPGDTGQEAIWMARRDRSVIGVRVRWTGAAGTGECWRVRVGGRDHRANAAGGLQPVTIPLIAVEHVVYEQDYS